jgi:phage shock protein C
MKKLYRSSNRILAGVCGGIAEYFDVDPTLIRVVYVFLSIFSVGFPGLLLYIILMVLMPNYNQIENQ